MTSLQANQKADFENFLSLCHAGKEYIVVWRIFLVPFLAQQAYFMNTNIKNGCLNSRFLLGQFVL